MVSEARLQLQKKLNLKHEEFLALRVEIKKIKAEMTSLNKDQMTEKQRKNILKAREALMQRKDTSKNSSKKPV